MTCSTCAAALDIRAPLVRVRGGSIVAFCSAMCLEGTASPEAVAPTPPDTAALTVLLAVAETPEVCQAPSDRVAMLRPPGRSARWPMSWKVAANLVGAAVAVVLLGLLVQAVPSRPEPAAASMAVPPLAARPEPPLPERARAVLDGYLAADDPDLSFLAALALARLGHAGAVERLRAALRDPANPRHMRAAAALASRADPDALGLLRVRLDSRRREERAFAARALAFAGDASGREGLAGLLSSSSTRLGAAEALAALGDPRALAVLRREINSGDAETRARAATALGRAGDPAAAAELRRVLTGGRFEVGAAIALANLDDSAARPALLACLAHSALRADAALALARMGAGPPETLRDALEDDPPPGRVQAALAILLLAGEAR